MLYQPESYEYVHTDKIHQVNLFNLLISVHSVVKQLNDNVFFALSNMVPVIAPLQVHWTKWREEVFKVNQQSRGTKALQGTSPLQIKSQK